jgi:anthranilate synthase component II
MSRLLVIDNYDSFTYNLVHLIRELNLVSIEVKRNDKTTVEEASKFDHILLSPGPGIPSEAGVMPDVIRALAPKKNILGVCLGHQCIGEIFGSTLINMSTVCHGKGLETTITKPSPLFNGIPNNFLSGRYHSWMVSKDKFPDSLEVLATDKEDRIMALKHKQYSTWGVQFHPESVLTEHGATIVKNWLLG